MTSFADLSPLAAPAGCGRMPLSEKQPAFVDCWSASSTRSSSPPTTTRANVRLDVGSRVRVSPGSVDECVADQCELSSFCAADVLRSHGELNLASGSRVGREGIVRPCSHGDRGRRRLARLFSAEVVTRNPVGDLEPVAAGAVGLRNRISAATGTHVCPRSQEDYGQVVEVGGSAERRGRDGDGRAGRRGAGANL